MEMGMEMEQMSPQSTQLALFIVNWNNPQLQAAFRWHRQIVFAIFEINFRSKTLEIAWTLVDDGVYLLPA